MQRGSTQNFMIAKVKSRITDNTISMSLGVLRAPNADFDGDQLNLILILDNEQRRLAARLAPHLWVLSLNEPQAISPKLMPQGPIIDTLANFVHSNYLERA